MSLLYLLKAVLRSLILPPAGLLIVAIAGLLLLRRHRRSGVALILISIAALWLLATPIVADRLTSATERIQPLDPSKPVQAQAIVILGGGGVRPYAAEYGGGPAPQMELLERVTYGAYLARRTSLPVLVSGAPEEVTAMRMSLARDFGVSTRWVEDKSNDTFGNAYFSARLLHADHIARIILVTSSTHIWRATHEFEGTGLEVVPAPAGYSFAPQEQTVFRFIPSPLALLHSQVALYELLGESVREILVALHIRRQDKTQAT